MSAAPGTDGSARRTRRVAALLLLVAIAAAWLPSLDASFQFDDWNVIVKDARVQSLPAWAASMPGIRPLLKLSYALNHAVDSGPAGFRVVNLGLHALNALLLLTLLWRLGRALGDDAASAAGAALIAATIFALHPAQTEAVTYLSGRSSSMVATACLAALWLWVRGLDARREAAWHAGSLGVFALALGIKEVAVALPLVMLLWLWIAVPRPRHALRRVGPHFALLAAGAVIVLAWPAYRHLLEASLATRAVGANLLVQAQAIVYLCGQLLWPAHLNADPMLRLATTATPAALAAGLLLLAVAGYALLQHRRQPALAWSVLWFFAWLLPTNSALARLDFANDRQLYLAMAGPAWLLGRVAVRAARSRGLAVPAAALGAALACAVLLGSATLLRNRVYMTEIAFWRDVTSQSPHNARAANNLGYAYALACRDEDARREFSRAVQLDPGYWIAGVNRRLLREGALFISPPDCARRARPH